jgi:hypothetical protein
MTIHALTTLSNTSATRLTPIGTHSGIDITLQNVNNSGYIYIGGNSEVSDDNYGFRLMPNHSISFELPGKDKLYAIASVNEMKIAVIKTNLESGQ